MPIGKPAQRYRCTICKEFKRKSSFPKSNRTVTGVKTTCSMCQRSVFSKWYHSNGGKKALHNRRSKLERMKKRKIDKALIDVGERMKLGIHEVPEMVPGLRPIRLANGYAAVKLRAAKFMLEREPNDPFWAQYIKDNE